jgi:hypothetical protein
MQEKSATTEVYRVDAARVQILCKRKPLTALAFEKTRKLPLRKMEQEWNDASGSNFWDKHRLTIQPDGAEFAVVFTDGTDGLCPHSRQPAECGECRADAQIMYDWERRVPFWMSGLEHLFDRCPHGEDPALCDECRRISDAAEAVPWETPYEEVAHA